MEDESEVLEAIEAHNKAVDGSIAGLNKTIAQLQKEGKEEKEYRNELERKINLLRTQGSGSESKEDLSALFAAAHKAAYPTRQDLPSDFDYKAYRKAFGTFLRGGREMLSVDEHKAMQVGIDTDGGYLAPLEFVRQILRSEGVNSVMRGIARVFPMGADAEFPRSLTRPAVGWVGEVDPRTAIVGNSLGLFTMNSKEIYCMPEATQKLIDDSAFDIEGFVGEEIGIAFGENEDAQFIGGDGLLKPHGFTNYPTAATSDAAGTRPVGTIEHIATGQAGAWPTTAPLIYDKLVDVVHALRPRYRRNARWIMPTEAITKLRKMKTTTTDEPMWQPSMSDGQPDRLLGYPVTEAEQMPAVAANSLSVAFGDWKRGYWIGDRMGVRVLRDPYTNKPYIRFYTTKRMAGAVADSCAIKLLKFAAS
ncbi:MAG TPA: phage major capsid protein [Steroidobacteraceae bacterium]|nr:phage major capsid protein [Steroidobacteraceae bacterium]